MLLTQDSIIDARGHHLITYGKNREIIEYTLNGVQQDKVPYNPNIGAGSGD